MSFWWIEITNWTQGELQILNLNYAIGIMQNLEVIPSRLMIGNNLLCQFGAVINNIYDVVIARVACSVPDDHPKTLGLASCGIAYVIQILKKRQMAL